MIEEDIRNFNKQFVWEPVIENESLLKRRHKAVVLGMGGSHLGADLLKIYDPALELGIHSDYGLPASVLSDDGGEHLIVASSYSGNTAEIIDGLNQAMMEGFHAAVVSSGGKLIDLAREKSLPYIQLPSGLQPRMSTGFQIKALAKLLNHQIASEEARKLADQLSPAEFEKLGEELAEKVKDKIPVIYASQANFSLAYHWKVKFNETGKVPAFYNVFPELNHNEINGFVTGRSDNMETFSFIFLADAQDDSRIQKRMQVLSALFKDHGFLVEVTQLVGEGRFHRLFSSLFLADWTAYYTAKQHGLDPEGIPVVEKFKKLIE